jgi:hypothetical protein
MDAFDIWVASILESLVIDSVLVHSSVVFGTQQTLMSHIKVVNLFTGIILRCIIEVSTEIGEDISVLEAWLGVKIIIFNLIIIKVVTSPW